LKYVRKFVDVDGLVPKSCHKTVADLVTQRSKRSHDYGKGGSLGQEGTTDDDLNCTRLASARWHLHHGGTTSEHLTLTK